MPHPRFAVGNNLLAVLAIMTIAVSCVNVAISFNFLKANAASPEGMQTSSGLVMACSSFTPQIEGSAYHALIQGQAFYYDFNVSGENESSIIYGDNSTMFNVGTGTGIVSFTPGSDDVGLHYYYINATENLCMISNSTYTVFNVTNLNDPPFLVALLVENATWRFMYPFPINSTVYLFEDSWYNISLMADDPDLYVPDTNETLTYGKIPPLLFVLNESTGNVTFMPVQADVGLYNFRFHVFDADSEVDQSAWILIRVLNVNDNPVLLNKTDLIGGLGAMTTEWGSMFYYDANATDEDGDVLSYHVDFVDCSKLNGGTNCTVFGINASSGEISFTPPFSDVGNYTVNYSATDGSGGVDWYLGSFSIAEWENEPPNITHWEPEDYNVTIFEGDTAYFLVNVTDDYGVPFASWYVDSAETGAYATCSMYQSSYTVTTSYEDSGAYNVTVMVGDGQYVVSHEWRLIVLDKAPPSDYRPRSSWGSGPAFTCIENWRCTEWSECAKDGLQLRVCVDISDCSTSYSRPNEVAYCLYTPSPTCFDGIRNCHGGGCEILADCGGPCLSCPTCSDGLLNCHVNGQCEEGPDCGGPCKPCVTAPDVPVCGNLVCEAGELYECYGDCADLWIDVMIFALIIILLVATSILLYVYRKETVLLYVYRKMKGE